MSSNKNPSKNTRLCLGLVSLVICILLVVSLLGTALLLDLRILASGDGLKTILTEAMALSSKSAPSAQVSPIRLSSDPTIPPELGDIEDFIPSGESISDIIASGGSVSDIIQQVLGEALGEDAQIDPETVQQFVEDSTVMDYLSDKLSSYTDDMINGTTDTLITTEELMDLVEENQTLIEETFQVEITEEMKTEIHSQIDKVVVEEDLNATIHEAVQEAGNTPVEVPGVGEVTVSELLAKVRELTQPAYLALAIGLCLILMAALLGLCWYNWSAGLRRCGYASLVAGVPLAALLLVLRFGGDRLAGSDPDSASVIASLQNVSGLLSPVHYGIPILGLALLVAGILCYVFLSKKETVENKAEN